MAGYFALDAAGAGAFIFSLKAANHQVILTSETDTTKSAAEGGIESVKKNAADELATSAMSRRTVR